MKELSTFNDIFTLCALFIMILWILTSLWS